MKHISKFVNKDLKKTSNNNSKNNVLQYNTQKDVKHNVGKHTDITAKMFLYSYDKLKRTNNKFIKISHDVLDKILKSGYLKSPNEFIVFIILYILYNQFTFKFYFKDIKSLPKYVMKKQREILGDKQLVSESKVYEIIKKFKDSGILKKSSLKINYVLEILRPEKNEGHVQFDLNFIYQLMRDSKQSSHFFTSFYLFYYSYKQANKNNYFNTSYAKIAEYSNFKVSSKTVQRAMSVLKEKNIIAINEVRDGKFIKYGFTFNPNYFNNLLPKNKKMVKSVKCENSRNVHREMGHSDLNSRNVRDIYKVPFIENPISEKTESDEISNDLGEPKNDFFDNLITQLENTDIKIDKNKKINEVKFTVDKSDDVIEPIPEKVETVDDRTNYGLNYRYGLSFKYKKNIDLFRSIIKRHSFFNNKSPNKILYDVFEMVNEKGAWPFAKDYNPIKIPIDAYLQNNKDGKGTIFEKILLNDYKLKIQDKIKKDRYYSSEERKQRDYQAKVNFLMQIDCEGYRNEFERIENLAFQKLNEFEQDIIKRLPSWNEQHKNVSSKLNFVISSMVYKRSHELDGIDINKENISNYDKKNYNYLSDICKKLGLNCYLEGVKSLYHFLIDENPYIKIKEIGIKVKEYLKNITRNNPEFNELDFGI